MARAIRGRESRRDTCVDEIRLWIHPLSVGGVNDGLFGHIKAGARRLTNLTRLDNGIMAYAPRP